MRSIRSDPAVSVIYESPHRIGRTLADLAQAIGPRRAVVLRELTKQHEETADGTLESLAARFSKEVKGEITLVIEGCAAEDDPVLTDNDLEAVVRDEIANGGSAKDVANTLSRNLGLPRKKIYEMAVAELKRR